MNNQQLTIHEILKDMNQDHVIQAFEGATPEQKKSITQQLNLLNQNYPGGIKNYYIRAKKLLKDSAQSVNPYEDYDVDIPTGINLNFTQDNFQMISKYEKKGFKQFQKTAFVLVAGGLGERLGYPGIKISIPFELLTGQTFIRYYIQYILAFQKKFCQNQTRIPLVIMTSDDTYQKTVQLLEKNSNFGMDKDQIIIVKQEKVPAFIDNQAKFSLLNKDNKIQLETKPHGHGDIHTLLYLNGIAEKWQKQGKKWIIFFQDTNPLVFRSFPAFLGVSEEKDFQFNIITVNRKPGETVGAIATLIHKETKKTLTINVQYNQLENIFKQNEPVDENGFSRFPGNTNCFVIRADKYYEILTKTKGEISQFINPKYADATKTKLKSSARLECMMQDYPKLLDNCDHVGYTSIDKGYSFTTVKNDLSTAINKYKANLKCESASSCEADFYFYNRQMLRLCGAQIEEGEESQFSEMKLPLKPMIYFSPKFATCITEMKQKIKKLKVEKNGALVIKDDCVLDDVEVSDGHLELSSTDGKSLSISVKKAKVPKELSEGDPAYLKIRGYKIQ